MQTSVQRKLWSFDMTNDTVLSLRDTANFGELSTVCNVLDTCRPFPGATVWIWVWEVHTYRGGQCSVPRLTSVVTHFTTAIHLLFLPPDSVKLTSLYACNAICINSVDKTIYSLSFPNESSFGECDRWHAPVNCDRSLWCDHRHQGRWRSVTRPGAETELNPLPSHSHTSACWLVVQRACSFDCEEPIYGWLCNIVLKGSSTESQRGALFLSQCLKKTGGVGCADSMVCHVSAAVIIRV